MLRLPSTLRARFALWVAALLLVTLGAFAGFVYVEVGRGLADSIDESLEINAGQALTALQVDDQQLRLNHTLPISTVAELEERGFTIRVLDADGAVLQAFGRYRASAVDPASVAAAQRRKEHFATVTLPPSETGVRWFTAPILRDDRLVGMIQVAQSLADVGQTLRRIGTAFVLSLPVLVVLAALGGFVLARRALAPIDHITRTARRLGAQDLHARLHLPSTDDEVGRLAATFDEMLVRLDTAFARERRFTADASHELRTPLAAMQVILGVIRSEPRTTAEYEEALDDLAHETQRLRALTDDLLALVRADTHQRAALVLVDVAQLASDVAETLRPLAEAAQLSLTTDLEPGLLVHGDPDSLVRLLVNLVDNAIRYTPAGGIQIVGRGGSSVQLLVTDTGVGIAPEHLPHIFERFYRVDPARSGGGTGLGLALAAGIARAHGGAIRIQSELGRGTTCTVTLPSAGALPLPGNAQP